MRVVELVKQVVQTEAEALSKLVDQIDESFAEAIEIIQKCQGKVVVTGVGKSGMWARRLPLLCLAQGLRLSLCMHVKLFMAIQV